MTFTQRDVVTVFMNTHIQYEGHTYLAGGFSDVTLLTPHVEVEPVSYQAVFWERVKRELLETIVANLAQELEIEPEELKVVVVKNMTNYGIKTDLIESESEIDE